MSYTLLSEKYLFRGHPDFAMYEEDSGEVCHILVGTGEVQSTSRPDVQNSIHEVGSLLRYLHLVCVNSDYHCDDV